MSNTDIPSLPTGWEACCFGDIARIRNGYAFKSELFKKVRGHESDVPLIRQSQMKGARIDTSDAVFLSGDHLKKHSDYVITKGDVIIGMSGSIGKVCLYADDFPALQNQRTGKIVPHLVSELNPKFFGLFLSNIERELTEFAKGMGVQNISAKDIEQLPFNLPPKNEQHRIVAKIEELFSELDKGIEALKTAQAQLKVYRQALLKHAFEGKLTAQWRAENQDKLETADALLKRIQQERAQRYQQQLADWQTNVKQGSLVQRAGKPKAPKPLPPLTAEELAELPELPEGWGWIKLGDAVETNVGFAFKSSDFSSSGIRLLRGENIEPRQLRWTDTRFWPNDRANEFEALLVMAGEIIIAMDRPVISSGLKVTRVRQSDTPCLLVQRVARIKEQQGICTSYIFSAIDQNRFINHCLGNQTGTQLPHISEAQIRAYPVPLCSYEEQSLISQELDSRMSEVDQLEQTITTSLQQAEALRQSILKKAFAGLLVPQDPHDEPASALLARIKAERATVVKNETVAAKARKRSIGDKLSRVEISRLASLNKEPRPC